MRKNKLIAGKEKVSDSQGFYCLGFFKFIEIFFC